MECGEDRGSTEKLEEALARIAVLEAALKPFAKIYKEIAKGKSVTFGNGDIYKQAEEALRPPQRGSG